MLRSGSQAPFAPVPGSAKPCLAPPVRPAVTSPKAGTDGARHPCFAAGARHLLRRCLARRSRAWLRQCDPRSRPRRLVPTEPGTLASQREPGTFRAGAWLGEAVPGSASTTRGHVPKAGTDGARHPCFAAGARHLLRRCLARRSRAWLRQYDLRSRPRRLGTDGAWHPGFAAGARHRGRRPVRSSLCRRRCSRSRFSGRIRS